MSGPASFEVLLFFLIVGIVIRALKNESLRTGMLFLNGTFYGKDLESVTGAWRILLEEASLQRLSNAISPHMWYDEGRAHFLMVSNHAEVRKLLQEISTLREHRYPLQWVVDEEMFSRTAAINKAPHHLTYPLTDSLHLLIMNFDLKREGDKRPDSGKYMQRGTDCLQCSAISRRVSHLWW